MRDEAGVGPDAGVYHLLMRAATCVPVMSCNASEAQSTSSSATTYRGSVSSRRMSKAVVSSPSCMYWVVNSVWWLWKYTGPTPASTDRLPSRSSVSAVSSVLA